MTAFERTDGGKIIETVGKSDTMDMQCAVVLGFV